MKAPPIELGTILPLTRRLTGACDPLALYASLSDVGRHPGTVLLESADTTTGAGERSIVVAGASAHLSCRGRCVELRALDANGEALAAWLTWTQSSDATSSAFARRDDDVLTWTFADHRQDDVDERTRLLAPSPLDVLRRIVRGPRLASVPVEPSHFAAGIITYDLLELFEPLPAPAVDDAEPLFDFWLADRFVVVDHRRQTTTVAACAYGGPGSDERYHDATQAVERLARLVERSLLPGDGDRTATHASLAAGGPPHREVVPVAPNPAHPKHAPTIASSPRPHRGDAGRAANPSHRNPPTVIPAPPLEPQVDLDDASYAAVVEQLQQHIVAGDVFQIVPSRGFRLPCPDPLAAYAELRATNPSPYMFYVAGERMTLFGTSPETCVKVFAADGGRGPLRMRLKPIAGTAARGLRPDGTLDADLDARREAALRLDAKEAAEHLMLVDLARNDVARVSRAGTRAVTKLLAVERFSRVMHLVSEVEGELDDGLDALHAYTGSLNMGTLVGAPKVRAAQLLRDVEPRRRGAYGGAAGYVTSSGEMDTAIVIRSAVVREGVAEVRAGAGVVFDSSPLGEALETRRKAEAVLRALRAVQGASAPSALAETETTA